MAADIQIGHVQAIGTSRGLGYGFTLTVRGQTVASVAYRTQVGAESARDTIAKALADAIEAVAPPRRP